MVHHPQFSVQSRASQSGDLSRYFAGRIHLRLNQDIVGKFIDASVSDHTKAERLLHRHPDLRQATWLGDEHLLNFLVIENFGDGVRFCLENGFDANQPDGEFGDTPLHFACMLDYPDIACLLLQHGANPCAVSEVNETPLLRCIENGNATLVELLIKSGADVSYRTPCGDTIFDNWPDDIAQTQQLAAILLSPHITRQAK